jgi:hypothetical protein
VPPQVVHSRHLSNAVGLSALAVDSKVGRMALGEPGEAPSMDIWARASLAGVLRPASRGEIGVLFPTCLAAIECVWV